MSEEHVVPTEASPMEDFFIADQQEEGIKVPLYKPDGSLSDHHFIIHGHFSKAFQRAKRDIFANAAKDFKKLKGEEREQALELRRLRLVASLVKSWSFPQECTEENKVAFFRKAPQIAEMVDQTAGEESLFTKASSNS